MKKLNLSSLASLFLFLLILSPIKSQAQSLYAAIDWHMVAVVSSNDYTNGISDGAPGLTIGADFGGIAVEGFYKRYKLAGTYENADGLTEMEFKDNIFGIGAKLTHNIFFLSRFGFLFHDVESNTVNSLGKIVNFGNDGTHVGFYFGGGVQLPISSDFFFHTTLNLETGPTDLTTLGLFVGLRYNFMGL